MRQISPESEPIFDFIIACYHSCKGDWASLQKKAAINNEGLKYFLEYSAQFLGNSGNYKGFGDVKFVPRTSEDVFAAIAAAAGPEAEKYYKATNGAIFSNNSTGLMLLGFPEDGHISNYYPDSPTVTKAEIAAISEWLEEKKLLVENTRLRKTPEGDFEILIASAVTQVPSEGGDIGTTTTFKSNIGPLKGHEVRLVYGDHSSVMAKVAEFQAKAAENACNENQKAMQDAYVKSFYTGSLEAFKDSQRHWIKDKGPMVESNIGFVETYRDPHGVRGEWEGFAAIVNLERTAAFGKLVDSAPAMIPKLPWSSAFEKDKFNTPDFTSLEVLSFAGSGIPAGINIPNYDDIRQTEGFKNVSLGNVLAAVAPSQKFPFIRDQDLETYKKYHGGAFEIQVGIHELLGHGTGKLLQETSPGVYNFDHQNPPISPITNRPITSWYKPGQTWGSVFSSTASSYEECRAECVAMALCCDFEILKIFGFGDGKVDMDGEAGDVLYTCYLSMARAGVASVEMWDPKSRKWGQIHSQARFAILQCFLEAGEDFCKLEYEVDAENDGALKNLHVRVDRGSILTKGRKAVEGLLQKLHVYKATADYDNGKGLYDKMTEVDPQWWGGKVREEVVRNRQPRKVYVQANTFVDAEGKVTLKEYEPSVEGVIQSFAERGI